MIILLISIIICIILGAFYSGSETAFISVNRMKLRHQAESGDKSAVRVLDLIEDMDRLLATTLIGTNIFVVAPSALMALLLTHLVNEPQEWMVVVVLAPVMLIFSEILPKTFFRQKADETISALEKPIALSARMFAPVIIVTTFFSQLLLGRRSKGLQIRKSPFVSREELKYLVRESEKEGVVEPQERLFIQSIFNLDKRKIRQVMVELKQTVLLRDSAGYLDVLALIKKTHFSRFPVYSQDRENIIGVVNVLDVLCESKEKVNDLSRYIRPPLYLKADMPADQALVKLQARKQPMAIVRDEQGRNIGMVTIEDIVEEIVGEI